MDSLCATERERGYLGPVINGQGHHVMLKLKGGDMKRCVARSLKLAYPVVYSSNHLPTICEFNPDEPDYEQTPGVALPRKDGGALEQPPKAWWEDNPTERCPGCSCKSPFHSKRCKNRYARYLRDALEGGDEAPQGDKHPHADGGGEDAGSPRGFALARMRSESMTQTRSQS